jgi:hypothetical protein
MEKVRAWRMEGGLIASRSFQKMNRELIIRLCFVALALLVASLIWEAIKEADDGMKLVSVILLGVTGGILMVKFVIPWIGDAMGEAVFSSGEQLEQDEMTKAAVCISQGHQPLRKNAGGKARRSLPGGGNREGACGAAA